MKDYKNYKTVDKYPVHLAIVDALGFIVGAILFYVFFIGMCCL